jgi:hypothetical protein
MFPLFTSSRSKRIEAKDADASSPGDVSSAEDEGDEGDEGDDGDAISEGDEGDGSAGEESDFHKRGTAKPARSRIMLPPQVVPGGDTRSFMHQETCTLYNTQGPEICDAQGQRHQKRTAQEEAGGMGK